MALIRWGLGSQLYIFENCANEYTCCDCEINSATSNFPDKESLKQHILRHKQVGHAIGLVGNTGSFQSYDELLQAVDEDDF